MNVSEDEGLSLVVFVGPRENRRIIAESRYMLEPDKEFADVAFMVDEEFHGRGIASFLLKYMIESRKRGESRDSRPTFWIPILRCERSSTNCLMCSTEKFKGVKSH